MKPFNFSRHFIYFYLFIFVFFSTFLKIFLKFLKIFLKFLKIILTNIKMDLFNQYLDRQITLNTMANQFSASSSQQFMRTKNDAIPKGGGLATGSGLNQESNSGLVDTTFKKRSAPVKEEMQSDEKTSIQDDESAPDGYIRMSGTAVGSSSGATTAFEDVVVAVEETKADDQPQPEPQPDEGKHNDEDNRHGFAREIQDFGLVFKQSASKAMFFIPNDTTIDPVGFSSISKSDIKPAVFKNVKKNGDTVEYTYHGAPGIIHVMNTQNYKRLRRR
jgi:hypothetical protein